MLLSIHPKLTDINLEFSSGIPLKYKEMQVCKNTTSTSFLQLHVRVTEHEGTVQQAAEGLLHS